MFNKKLYGSIIFLVFLIIIFSQIIIVSAEFSNSNVTTWGVNKDSIKKFEVLKDKDKNDAWKKASAEEKEKFVKAYSESKGGKVEFSGFSNKDLFWEGNKLVVTNGKKKPSYDFNSRDSLKKVSYDEKTKTIIYEFEKGDVKNQLKTDDGYIDKEGYLSKDIPGGFLSSAKTEKIANVLRGNGLLEYKDGAFYSNSEGRGVQIGNNYYTQAQKDEQMIVRPDANGAVSSHNAKILLLNKDSDTAYAVLSTSAGKAKDGTPAFVSLFDGVKVPEGFKDPYASVDTKLKNVILNDNKGFTGKDTYMNFELFSNFNDIKGSGVQTWVKNGNALFDFQDGKLVFAEGTRTGAFEVSSVSNLVNKDYHSNVFTFKQYPGYSSPEFYDKERTLIDSGMLVSETSGMHNLRGKPRGGGDETGYSNIQYDPKYEKGVFQGTEQERLTAIANDPYTIVEVHGTPSISMPGDIVSAEILANLQFQASVASLQLAEKGLTVESAQALLDSAIKYNAGSLTGNSLSLVSDPVVRAKVADQLVLTGSAKTLTQANALIDGYIINSNYNPNYDYSKVTSQNINNMPGVNRLLYDLTTQYSGDIYIPATASLRDRPRSTGGISELQITSDGVYASPKNLDGTIGPLQKLEGVSPQVATAFKSTVSNGLLNFEDGVATRQNQISTYGIEKIQQAGYLFNPNNFPTQRYVSNVKTSGLFGAKSTGQALLNEARAKLNGKLTKVQVYQSSGKLPLAQ